MNFDKDYILNTIKEIMAIDSPSGYTTNIIEKIEQYVTSLGYPFERSVKGNGIITIDGNDNSKTVGVSAHVDTLGLMVRSIKGNGNIAITRVGGPTLPTLDSELCRVITREGKIYSGTIFSTSPAAHVYQDASSKQRSEENLEVILDEIVKSKDDTAKLGIANGDFICIDPKTIITDNGFIKSRFLDDKLSVAILLCTLKYLKDNNLKPTFKTKFIISTYEEVGHGSANIPSDISELLAVDMGCIGLDLDCTIYDVSICAKDSSGPYDYDLTNELINLAKTNNLSFAIDIYPMYGSDVSAARSAGNDIKGALIGPGVFASHGYERSHYDGVENSLKLLTLFLTKR